VHAEAAELVAVREEALVDAQPAAASNANPPLISPVLLPGAIQLEHA
jgi:hypothetical protein